MLTQWGSRKNTRSILASLKRIVQETIIHFFEFGIKKWVLIFSNKTWLYHHLLCLYFRFVIDIIKFLSLKNTVFFHLAGKLSSMTSLNISSFLPWKKNAFSLWFTCKCFLKVFMARKSFTFLADYHLSLMIQSNNSQRMNHVFIITTVINTWFFNWFRSWLYILRKQLLNCNHFCFDFFFFLAMKLVFETLRHEFRILRL